MRKRLALVLVALVAAGTFVWANGQKEAAGSSGPGKISVMFQGTGPERDALSGVIARFEKQTGVQVEPRYTPHDVYYEKVSAAVAGKNLPDVMEMDAPFLANFVWSGYLAPAADYVDKSVISDMTPSSIAQCTYPLDNKLYAIGPTDSTVLLYGNRDYLKKIGARIPTSVSQAWTKDEFDTILQKLSQIPGVKWPLDLFRNYGVKTEWSTYAFQPIFESFGGGFINTKTWKAEGTLDSPESVAAATEMQKWVKNGWVVPSSAGTNSLYRPDHLAGLAWGGNWYWGEAHPAMGDNLVALPLPNFGHGVKTPNGTWIWGITKTSKDKADAGKYLSFMVTDQKWRSDLQKTAAYPGLKSWAANYPLYSDPSQMKIAFEQSNFAVPRPKFPGYPTLTSSVQEAIDNIFNGADPKTELTKAAKAVDQDISDHNGYPPFASK
jgi:multiple sugar transport system substrate-binding protein